MLKYILFILLIMVSSCDDKKTDNHESPPSKYGHMFSFDPSSIILPTGTFSFNKEKCDYIPQYYFYPFSIKITTADGDVFTRNVTIEDSGKEFTISKSLSISFQLSINDYWQNLFMIYSSEAHSSLSIELHSSIAGTMILPMQQYSFDYNLSFDL